MTPLRIEPVAVVAQSLACATGVGLATIAAALQGGETALQPSGFTGTPLPCSIGRIAAIKDQPLPPALAYRGCSTDRANRAVHAAWGGLQADDFIATVSAARRRVDGMAP